MIGITDGLGSGEEPARTIWASDADVMQRRILDQNGGDDYAAEDVRVSVQRVLITLPVTRPFLASMPKRPNTAECYMISEFMFSGIRDIYLEKEAIDKGAIDLPRLRRLMRPLLDAIDFDSELEEPREGSMRFYMQVWHWNAVVWLAESLMVGTAEIIRGGFRLEMVRRASGRITRNRFKKV